MSGKKTGMKTLKRLTEVRLCVIGLGQMGQTHVNNIQAGMVPGLRVTAVCDANEANVKKFPDLLHFNDHKEALQSEEVDAVLIATPHFFHTSIGIDALQAGMHVLVEKPLGVHKADCERLIKAYDNRPYKNQIFCAMFQHRTDPMYKRIRNMIRQGELGQITRVNWIITDWYRTEAYYQSGAWRATWAGEGGGVLLNQAPHNLDLMQWMVGMPSKLRSWCRLGQWHDIEVEDDSTTYMQFANGATGVFITTTGEAPGTNRLEICGEHGRLVLEDEKLTFTRNEKSMIKWSKTQARGFTKPPTWECDVQIKNPGAQHNTILKNFTNAITKGEKLATPAQEGLNSVELANAMLYSSLTNKEVELPLSGAAYERKLKQLIKDSKPKKKVTRKKKVDDFANSF